MARLDFFAHTNGEIALATAVAKTVLQIAAPANQRVAIKGFSISFDGTSATAEAVVVELCRQSGATTGSSAATIAKRDPAWPTVQSTALKNLTAGVETTDEVVQQWDVHPQAGVDYAFTLEDEVILAGGGKIGVRCTAPASVNCLAKLFCEE
ncbi:MAG: hypothetical protein C5B54_05100 [Acidobacteria bacterium]|nr:MAG: hypothetical protein C5B54_05100 [Acidobacteriota bacterium]